MKPNVEAPDLLPNLLDRRKFLRRALASGAGAALVPAALTLGERAARADETSDELATDLLVANFALNLEYLEAEYYSLGITGMTLAQRNIGVSGQGNQGTVTVKANPQVTFQTAEYAQLLTEITNDEIDHVVALRGALTSLGSTPYAEPNIDLLNSFNALGMAAGMPNGFDPFASELNFILGGFVFEDVGVTAYNGGAGLITNKTVLSYASSILPIEGYHAATLRTLIYQAGGTTITTANAISTVRDSLDTPKNSKDQGVTDASGNANITPTKPSGLAYARSARQVMNIVYGAFHATSGGFFPSGMNLP